MSLQGLDKHSMDWKKLSLNKEFFNKYKIVLMCVLCTIFALLTPLWGGFYWFNVICIGVVVFCFGVEAGYCLYAYLYFYTSLTGNQFLSYVLWGVLFLFVIIRHLILVYKKQEKIARLSLQKPYASL